MTLDARSRWFREVFDAIGCSPKPFQLKMLDIDPAQLADLEPGNLIPTKDPAMSDTHEAQTRTFRVILGRDHTVDVGGTHVVVNRQSHNGRVLDELLIYNVATEVARFQTWVGYKEV